MAVLNIHAYLVHPKRGSEDIAQARGADVPLSGRIYDLMNDIFDKSGTECDIDITFKIGQNGTQQNDLRDLLVAYAGSPSSATGQPIAERLGAVTDLRSGLGLLILVLGSDGLKKKIIISRFPTNSAIYVDEKATSFTLEFLDRVFVKSKNSYKAALYVGQNFNSEFWSGRAVDKQLGGQDRTSNYWISDFLQSDFTVTSAQGTKRLARALRSAVEGDIPITVKQEITAAVTLCSSLPSVPTSIEKIIDNYGLSNAARDVILSALKSSSLAKEQFIFDSNDFKSIIALKSVELDNGAILTADADKFDEVFSRSVVKDETRYVTVGRPVDERLRAKFSRSSRGL